MNILKAYYYSVSSETLNSSPNLTKCYSQKRFPNTICIRISNTYEIIFIYDDNQFRSIDKVKFNIIIEYNIIQIYIYILYNI